MSEATEKIVEAYKAKNALYTRFAEAVSSIVGEIAEQHQMKHLPLTPRAKDVEKLREKIERKGKDGKIYNDLTDIEDLAGTRIIFYLESDRKSFVRKVYEAFGEDNVKVEDKDEASGYRATHIIVQLDPARLAEQEYAEFAGLKCEVQITSILFHAWSEIEHDIIYKPSFDRQKLEELGLDELKGSFEKVMGDHIRATSYQFDFINKRYKDILTLGRFLATDFITEISQSKNNDEILQMLEVLENFCHKKPDETFQIAVVLIERDPIEALPLGKWGSHTVYGKKYDAVLHKAIELLERIRYFKLEEVLGVCAKLLQSEDPKIKATAKKIVTEASKFNYNFLTQAKTYAPQRAILDFILKWTRDERATNIEFIEAAAHELLGSSVSGTTNSAMDAITFHNGAVQPTDFLKKIRRETIDLVADLYEFIPKESKKIELAKVLEAAVRTPMSAPYGDDVAQMVADDAKHLLGIYRKMLFDDKGSLIGSIGVAEEVEKRLFWFHKSGKLDTPEAQKLREDILNDPFYSLFRLLAGDDTTFMQENGWEEAEKKRAEQIDEKLAQITKETLSEWIPTLNRIAAQSGVVPDWQFRHVGIFLKRLALQKPEVAAELAITCIKSGGELAQLNFFVEILNGYREANRLDLWEKIIEEIVGSKNTALVPAIAYSLIYPDTADLSKVIKADDLAILKSIVARADRFEFFGEEHNGRLEHSLLAALTRNFKRDPELIESLLLSVLRNTKGNQHQQIHELYFGVLRGWLSISEFSSDGIAYLKGRIVEIPSLDWDTQNLIFDMAKKDIQIIYDIFWERIEKEVQGKESEDWPHDTPRYDAIPHHWNDELSKALHDDPQFIEHVEPWLDKVGTEWSLHSWNISEFLKAGKYSEVIRRFVDAGGDENLKKAVQLMNRFQLENLELCMEIVGMTDDPQILSVITGMTHGTGVVVGENGIAEAYEHRANDLERYVEQGNDRVKKFVEKTAKDLREAARRDRLRTEEEREYRRLEFEG